MTCSYCDGWAATSRAQLRTRQKNLGLGGDIYACPRCGTRDWALTESKIVDTKRGAIRERKRTKGLLFGAFIILMMVAVYILSR